MAKFIDWALKVTSLVLIFVAPAIYLMWKYNNSETYTVEVTDNSMPIFIVIILSILVIFIISYIFSQTMALIKDSPFGYGSIFFFGGLFAGISVIVVIWIDKLNDLIEYNVEQFTMDLATYKHSMIIIIAYVIAGLVVATTGIIIKKTR